MARLTSLIAVLATLLLIAGGCGGGDGSGSTSSTASTTTPADRTSPPSSPEPPGDTVDVYFTSGEQFRRVERKLPDGPTEKRLEAAIRALLAGPTKREATTDVETATQIPAGTTVEDVTLAGDRTAVVEVSAEFTAGIPEDPAARTRAEDSELDARLSQVTYTLTQFPQVKRTKVVAGGEPVEAPADRGDLAPPERGPRPVRHRRGERGSSVRALQERLAELHYLPRRAIDGVEGYRTQQAVIAFQSWRGLDRDGIVGPQTSAALAKASPPRPHGDGPSRRIEIYREKGVALLIKDDRTVRAIHVSAGAPGTETPSGTFRVFRKELRSWSVPFQTWLPYASYFSNGIALHEYPDVPAYPASHGCVRVPAPEAKGVYRFAKIDTTVIVF